MDRKVTKAAILGALSQALDLVEGQPEGHALRTCLIAVELGRRLGLPESTLNNIYFASLLKDTGCSNNSVRIYHIFGGDELANKRAVKLIDWSNPMESLKFAVQNTEKGRGLGAKLRKMAENVGPPAKIMNEVTAARCHRGAAIAQKLGMGEVVARAIRCLDEHWDGRGSPEGLSGSQIPIEAMILGTAQTVEIFYTAFGPEVAQEMVKSRAGRWFDPQVAKEAANLLVEEPFWQTCRANTVELALQQNLPAVSEEALEVDVDAICEAFGMIVDAKSSFTWEHSSRVTRYATELAVELGVPFLDITTIRRAAMVHDIGKLGISSSILEKPDRLTPEELSLVQRHPEFSYQILSRVPTFEKIAEVASDHHERLDGKGYWRGIDSDHINLATRIVTVADVFDALTAKRPYKEALPLSKVLEIMERDRGCAFDSECLDALSVLYPLTSVNQLAA